MKATLPPRPAPAAVLVLLASVALAPGLGAAEKRPLPKDLPPFGEDKPLPVPTIGKSTLPNGLSRWVVKRPGFPRVVVVLAVRGGTAADPKGQEGIATLLADTLKEGTATRSSRAIAEELQGVGADISTSASDEAIFVSADGLASGVTKILAVLADVARNPSFPRDEVELARNNALQNLQVQESTPEFLARKAFANAVYGEHPYHVTAASKETLSGATPEQLRKEHDRRFRPDGALLVVVGDVDPAVVDASVKQSFGAWKGTGEGVPATPPSPGATGRRILVVHRPGSVQSQIVVGRPTPTVTDPDYYPLLVANTICAGSFGSRLVENIREDKGYTYSPRGSIRALPKGGLLTVQADVRNEVTGASLLEMFYELDRMGTTEPSEEELQRAKRYQSGLYLLRNQIQGAVARTLANNWVNGLPPEALGEFVPKVNAVTAAEVHAIGRKVYPSSTQTVVIVGDEAKVKEEVSALGSATEVKP
jgi:predicted Zn-dependent peptidase